MWLPGSSLSAELNDDEDLIVDYLITITSSTNESNYTTGTNLTSTLEFNKTYSIAIYALRCNGTLTSEPFITNITINKGKTK